MFEYVSLTPTTETTNLDEMPWAGQLVWVSRTYQLHCRHRCGFDLTEAKCFDVLHYTVSLKNQRLHIL